MAACFLLPAYAGGVSHLQCRGVRRVTASRLVRAVPGLLEVGAAAAAGVFAYWVRFTQRVGGSKALAEGGRRSTAPPRGGRRVSSTSALRR